MYALETSSNGHLSSETSSAAAVAHHAHLEQMASNLYNLDSATMSATYSHPSSHSPYNNSTAHSLLLPSSVNYHHLELNPVSASTTHPSIDTSATDTHPRLASTG